MHSFPPAKPSHIQQPTMAPFRLRDLPGELRNNIYSKIPLSDKMTLLRTSRSISSEVSPLFYEEATYRILVNVHHPSLYTKHPITRPPPQHIKKKIQNLDVYWALFEPEKRKEGDIEALSWDPLVSRGLCRVFFGWCPGVPWLPLPFRDSDFEPLKTLAGFETVEIRIGLKALGRPHNHHARKTDTGNTCTDSDTSCPMMLPMYEVLRNGLESAFGVAELRQNPPDHYLRFEPGKHSADAVVKS